MEKRSALLKVIKVLGGEKSYARCVASGSETPGYDCKTGLAYDPLTCLIYDPDKFVSRETVWNYLVKFYPELFELEGSIQECVKNATRMRDIHEVIGWSSRESAEEGEAQTYVLGLV